MTCAWNELLSILPPEIRCEVDRLGKTELQELRLRIHSQPELVLGQRSLFLSGYTTREELQFCINTASKYSPWTATSIAQGYLTAPGGHRIGICGEAVMKSGCLEGIRNVNSLCIRVARDFPGVAKGIGIDRGSVLMIGPPGSGKTTLLRDLIRKRSNLGPGSVAVVDQRGELFPTGGCFPQGKRTDVLTGCDKQMGLNLVLRSMGPGCIAVDEITAEEDCNALIKAGWCGVSLLATAHASGKEDLFRRPVYQPLVKSGLFDTLVVLKPDKSWYLERMEP